MTWIFSRFGIKTPIGEIVDTIDSVVDLMKQHSMTCTPARPAGIEMSEFIRSRVFSADGGDLVELLLEDCRTKTPSPRIQLQIDNRAPEIDQREFAQVMTLWDNFRSSMLAYFEDFDILICPVNASTAIPIDEREDMRAYTYTSTYNLTGWPGVVIRAGTDNAGLPIGVQILARPFREDHCLAVAAWLEAHLGNFPHPEVFCG